MFTQTLVQTIDPNSDGGYSQFEKVFTETGINIQGIYGENLLSEVVNYCKDLLPLTLLIERNYTDKDFRSLYYRHYSKVFRKIDRQSVRIHLFAGLISSEALKPTNIEAIESDYYGYFCVSMLNRPLLGRTLLKYQENNKRDFICQTDFVANLFGCRFNIKGFPFIAQDGELTRCAHASLWMIHRYFSTRYPFYKEALPHEILWGGETPWRRLVPSQGLLVQELGSLLSSLNFHPEVINNESKQSPPPEKTDQQIALEEDKFFSQLHTYIESRIPVIACSYRLRHAVVIIGRSAPDQSVSKAPKVFDPQQEGCDYEGFNKVNYWDASDFCKAIIVNDDNYFPYKIWERRKPSDLSDLYDRTVYDIDYIIVPLYEKMFLSASLARKNGLLALSHNEIGIRNSIKKENLPTATIDYDTQFVLRTILTSSKTYLFNLKTVLRKESSAQVLRQLNLPKFVWLIEISTKELFFKNIEIDETSGLETGYKIGEILLDATAGDDFNTAWISIRYPGSIRFNSNIFGDEISELHAVPVEKESFPEPLLVNSF